MFEKPCKCGVSKKNFKLNIGPFYIDECCSNSGYDHLGNKKDDKVSLTNETKCPIIELVQSEEPVKKRRKRNKSGNLKKLDDNEPS